MSVTICEQVVEITSNYLGPAAKRFVYRQVTVHLKKSPEDLKQDDIPVLADWSKVALGLVTRDKKTVDAFQKELLDLTKSSK